MPTTQVQISTESLQDTDVIRASVRLREDWIERLRMKCDVDRLLTEVALQQKCHRVEVVFDGGIWHLVGCACGVNGAREELMQRKKTLDNQSTEDDTYLENGKSSKAVDAAVDDDADRCDAEERSNRDAAWQSAHGQGTAMEKKKNSPETNEAIQQGNCWSLEQNPRGNSPSGKGSKDRNNGTTKGPEKEYAGVRGHKQRDEVSKAKTDANKENSATAAACSSATAWCTQKHNSTQLKQQENPPKASGGERGVNVTESSSDVQRTTNSDEQRDRICALRMLRNVAVDRQVYDFLFRKRRSELSAISRRCSVFEEFDDGGCLQIAIEQGPGHDLDSIVSDLEDLRLQVTEQVVPFPADVCFDALEDSIRATTCCTDTVDLYFNSDVKICQMVGSQKDIEKVKEEIDKLMDANKGERFNASPDTPVKGHLNATPPPCHPPPPPAGSPVFTILSHDQCNMELLVNNTRDPIGLDLVCGDLIATCNADVLVTFVDHDLKPFGRLAKTIASQFHPSLIKELSSIGITRLLTGHLVHTLAQGLGSVKHLIHVVPPTEYEFPLTNPYTPNALQSVFTNCICCSNDKLTANSLCIPAVGCGTYPCSLVANCFVYALLQFHQSIINDQRPQHLRRIQMVNKDTRQMAELIDAMHRRLSNM